MKNNSIIHDFYCTQCGNKGIPIIRSKGFQRKPGHLKKLFCIYCQKENNFVEVNLKAIKYTYNDFLFEFEQHNFDENGNRIKDFNDLLKEKKNA